MSLRVLTGNLLLIRCLLHLMFGLTVVLFVMRFLVLLLLVLVCMLACMPKTGSTGDGGILMILVLLLMVCLLYVWVLALYLVLYRLFKGLSFGVCLLLALQATNAVHLGVDNLNVVRHVGRLLDGFSGVRPLELVDDGDLIILVRKLLSIRGEGTVCISKVKCHADESLVRSGQVRALDRYGNTRADEAADFGRRRVWPEVPDARRNLSGVCRRWYPVVLVLHRFFIAISRAVVNCEDSSGLAPHPLVWSAGSLPKRRRIVDVVRNVALLPCPLHLWDSDWVGVPPVVVSAEDVCLWQYSVGILVKLVTLLGTLHWPSAGTYLGPGGISYVELLILYELWAGERFQ